MKKTRQHKAKKIIMMASRRMAARLLAVSTKSIDSRIENEEVCERVRDLYERRYKTPDRLIRAYDLASLVR